jgi:very-short-patch-repair endonuclease
LVSDTLSRLRERVAEQRGWRGLRFLNNDVLLNVEGVAEAILKALRGE